MKIMHGRGVSDGIVHGKVVYYRPDGVGITRYTAEEEAEKNRFRKAQEDSIRQLKELAEKARAESGEETAMLFEIHGMLVEDPEFTERVCMILKQEHCNAEYAVQMAGEQNAARLEQLEDAYLQERAADIRDVTMRILENLTGQRQRGVRLSEPAIVAAEDLTPSETLQLDRSKVLAFVTRQGSENSHAAILARSMDIPAVCGMQELSEEIVGQEVWLDGTAGMLITDADEEMERTCLKKEQEQREHRRLLQQMKGKRVQLADGTWMRLYANISAPEDVEAVLENDGEGIGLFRSEFLYLASEQEPSEETQFEAYRRVLEGMEGKEVIIRTLDLGADKRVPYFALDVEENPAMGMRAIRICLERPELFRTQLRALYRASAYGKLSILFPMIASVWELQECRRLCECVRQELRAEGIPFAEQVPLGAMIETPAAVWCAEELAKEADFFSVGTNDLTQYTLACDRQSGKLDRFFDPHHPAVLRELECAAAAAKKAKIPIGICGEQAGEESLLPFFVKIGISELSVAPKKILSLREVLTKQVVCR